MDDAGLDYILMLRTNFGLYDELAEKSIDTIKSYRYSIENPDEEEIYGVSWDCAIYEKGPTCKAQIFWSAERYSDNQKEVINRINKERTYLQNLVETSVNKPYIEKDLKQLLKKIPPYFILETEPAPPVKIEQKLRGRGNGTKPPVYF